MQTIGLIEHQIPMLPPDGAAAGDRRFQPWAIGLSAALHGLVAGLILMAPPFAGPPPREEAVPVEVWTTDQLAAVTPPPTRPVESASPAPPAATALPLPSLAAPAPPPVAALPPQPPPQQPSMPRTHETIRPTSMLSASVLANPRSRGTIAFLKSLDADGRLEQLCNLEAMAQIGRSYPHLRADRVIAYATADTAIKASTLTAKGAAFHSAGDWIGVVYTCRSAPDRQTILSFEFTVGDSIPKRDWAAYNLPAKP